MKWNEMNMKLHDMKWKKWMNEMKEWNEIKWNEMNEWMNETNYLIIYIYTYQNYSGDLKRLKHI